MRREMIWAGGILACVVAVAIGARAAESVPVKVESSATESAVILLGDVTSDRLVPLPENYTVTRRYPDGHPMNNALASVGESCSLQETKEIYTSKRGTFGFIPGRGRRIADDLTTELVRDCSICSLVVRVSGGVEDGDDVFLADFSLYDSCPAAGQGGVEIPGTRLRFRDLPDDAGQFHDLVLDYTDRGACDDAICPNGSSCQFSLQNCMDGSCGNGSSCDPNERACLDGSECTDGTCDDESPCDPNRPACSDGSACTGSTCDDGSPCGLICGDGTECVAHLAGTCADDTPCDAGKQGCGDGSDCTAGTCTNGSSCDPDAPDCADQSDCVRVCDDGTVCELICGGESECVRVDCVGDPCSVSQQNCTGGLCADGSACDPAAQNCADESTCLGSACLEDPLQIPPTVWVRLRFDTDDAIVVMGSPPTRGFSADAYDDPQAFCTAWFGGWPVFPHASIFAEIIAPATCETHFLAYLAANPNKPPFLPSDIGPIPNPGDPDNPFPPFTTPATRLADDIRLTVDNCTLSAYELGMKGNIGEFTMEIDLRWPDVNTIQTEATFTGRGEGSAEIGHFTIDEDVNLSIGRFDQPIYMTWKSNKTSTGAMEVNITQAGTSLDTMLAFGVNTNLDPPEWSIIPDGDFSPAVFYAAIFCRGDAPRGACCPNQPAIPGSDMDCFDDVPVTSCLGTRWQINSTCEQNFFDPPCGTHACCLPNSNCDDFTLDDCVEECIVDVNIIDCEPVCNGGVNHRQPCNLANGNADCEDDHPACEPDCNDGVCDPDALCPGARECGLTGCQLNGEFTGRPCDLNNPNQGASDCMTCSGTGDYCRPRCVDGLARGRSCDGNADCPGSTCDPDFDCDEQTCGEVQSCAHDGGQCSLRCARWSSGRFCGVDNQRCPNFNCFDAVGDCFEEEDEHLCFGRCSDTRNCTSDSNCEDAAGDPVFGTCLPSGVCSGFSCREDDQCDAQGLGTCVDTDVDCPIGTRCIGFPNNVCTGRAGCDNLSCCGVVCRRNFECCESSSGQNWDDGCVSIATNQCTQAPGNDECHSNSPNEGAFEIVLVDDDTDVLCQPASDSCSAAKIANNKNATSQLSDPTFCCNQRGVNVGGAGTIWFKFEAMHKSALIHTCGTTGSATVINSIIQVFRTLDQSPGDGSDADECNSLEVIGCNDDAGSDCPGFSGDTCPTGGCMASLCVVELNIGEIYYIEMAASLGINQGGYKIEIESPCPSSQEPPPGSVCERALTNPLPEGSAGVPFDLADSDLDCPAETCLPAMTNDTWFLTGPTSCAGNLIIQTCGFDLGEPNPDTTLAVYRATQVLGRFTCPPFDLVGCNNDATIDPVCSIGGESCDVDGDCIRGCTGLSEFLGCDDDSDCPGNSRCDAELLAQCETVTGRCRNGDLCDPDGRDCADGAPCKGGIGDSSNTTCVPVTCTSDANCPGGTCNDDGICDPDDTQCNRGVCEDDEVTPCDASIFGHCTNGDPCDGVVDCADGSECDAQCGIIAPEGGRDALCLPQETCVVGKCGSACGSGSLVVVPTFQNQFYYVRVGGEFGSEPSGTVRIRCEFDDCNGNGVPDGIEIGNNPDLDCNDNGELDECDIDTGVSNDCNCNDFPDECEMDAEIPIVCSGVLGPCESGPFFCFNSLECDPDLNRNGIPDCCDEGELPEFCPDCPVSGACCDAGGCSIKEPADCTGLYIGDFEVCEPDTCTIGSCCEADETCRDGEVVSQCGGAGEIFRPGVDCRNVCVPPCSMADLTGIVFADAEPFDPLAPDLPGHCAIDAREPHSINDVNAREGWDRMVMEFSCDPTALGMVPGDFTVRGVPDVPVPGVLSVVIDNVDNTATVMLDDKITPGQWTCIEHVPSGNEWCMGYLPADANQDRLTAAGDINALINSINLVPGLVLPIYATDINRSGVTTGTDILRLIDLLNGAGDFDPWITQDLPDLTACPQP